MTIKVQHRLWDPPSPLLSGYWELFLLVCSKTDVKLTTNLHFVPRLRISGALPPSLHRPSRRPQEQPKLSKYLNSNQI